MGEPPPPFPGPALYEQASVLDEYFAARPAGESPVETMELPALWRAIGDVRGLAVLDLGCGDGWLGAALRDRGCSRYTGVDGSAAMVDRAWRRLGPGAVCHQRLEELDLEARGFDLAVSSKVLHYVEHLVAVLQRAAEHLRPGGRLVYTHEHPVITSFEARDPGGTRQAWTVDGYFRPGAREVSFLGAPVVKDHRTFEQHLAAVAGAGLELIGLSECAPVRERFGDRADEYERRLRIPLFLLVSTRRP
jgi:SAM-dependent methyltransferase